QLYCVPDERAGYRRRGTSPAAAREAELLATDDRLVRSLATFSCPDRGAEELRRSLALSVTHQEIVRALAGATANDGAVAVVRNTGAELEESQARMRTTVVQAMSDRIRQVAKPHLESEDDYEREFVRSCLALLGPRVRAARARGTRSHHFN